jgi:hypothetical protein
VVGRLSKTPPESEVALGFASGTTVYAVRVDGVSGRDILEAFVAERANLSTPSAQPIYEEVDGKQVVKVADVAGNILYASDDVFFTIEAPDDPTALAVLQQLPAQ